ncbi:MULTISPECIES: DUF1622 domain-containing protein [unclassified Xanthobacter]|uniref:DUF1622 domain-containing protein n=1 Tax=unclassified Xanthobacter TaxID=2623496 RepID=UPI001F3A6473|nr:MULTISPECIES: DUF1622 domain-containing protein [unclassified Xanthobacter]
MDHLLSGLLHWTTRGIEVAGTVVIVFGILMAAYAFARDLIRGRSSAEAFRSCRSSLGMAILLGLELLVAADIISTVAIEPSLESLAVLAGIVVIRTFLSFSLEVEIEGRWPWQAPAKGETARQAARNKA